MVAKLQRNRNTGKHVRNEKQTTYVKKVSGELENVNEILLKCED